MKYLKLFETENDRTSYENSESYIEPYVSYVDGGDVHYNKPPETRLIAKFNVTDTSQPTQLGYYTFISGFTKIEIDGVEQPSVVSAYTFDTTGEHEVKYTLADETTIGNMALFNCKNLTSITIPDNVTSIGNVAFLGCDNLSAVNISSLTAWCNIDFFARESNPLSYAGHLFLNEAEIIDLVIPNDVLSIKEYTFVGCSGLTSVTIHNNVTNIGLYGFRECSNLVNVTIGNNVTSISSYAFYQCSSLTSINIPDSVTSIGNSAFQGCYSLTSVNIPSGVTSIDSYAFTSCGGLTSITSLAATPPTLGVYTFDGTNDCPIYVPAASVDAYKAATNWSYYASRIEAIPTT